jgi:hypothetical protein
MGGVFSESWNSYAATADILNNWTLNAASGAWNATAGVDGGGAFVTTASLNADMTGPVIFSPSVNGAGIGLWVKISTTPAAVRSLVNWTKQDSSDQGSLRLNTNGTLGLYDLSGTSRLTGVTNVCDNNWHWIEWGFQYTSGTLQKCYVDTILQWNQTTAMGGVPTGIERLKISSNSNTVVTFSHIVVFDNASPSPQFSDIPIGPRSIVTLRPNGDSSIHFVPNSGVTNYTQVNETVADGDTSYVQSGTSGDVDLYDYADLSYNPGSISFVQITSRVKNPGTGTGPNYKGRVSSNGVTADTASLTTPSTNYSSTRQISNTDPNTSAAWGRTGLNAAKFGILIP